MNLKPLIFLLLLNSICFASGWKVFIPNGDKFTEVEIKVEKTTMTSICNFLGYNSDQFYTYNNYDIKDSKIEYIIFKVFTDDIICILTDGNVSAINKKDVDNYLSNYDIKTEFGSYQIESTLADGVKNKSLTRKFLSEIFKQKIEPNGQSIIAMEIGYELHFSNGILTKYNTTDGLNKWAKSWKLEMPSTYRRYLNSARMYSEDEITIINEINVQAEAFSRVPIDGFKKYIKFHTNKDGTINYKMLLVAHYGEKITLNQFKVINNGRYNLSTEYNDADGNKRTTYSLNKGLYTFNENGKLINSYTSE